MRTIWKGAISFGLVHIPVKLYPAATNNDLKFSYLHDRCGTPVNYRKYCPHCQTEVPHEETVKGYEYEKGRFVRITRDEFENIPIEANKAINIMDFVKLEDVDPVYFDKTYYAAPGEGGQKAYELLRLAMEKTGMTAIARVVIRSRESLAAIRVYNKAITVETMRYPDEIRPVTALTELNYNVEIRQNELEMAEGLINSLTERFDPGKYNDRYREALMELIQKKISGEEVTVPKIPREESVMDLVEALKASIQMSRERREAQEGQ
jgi:DNA end-binding protein Ku